MKMMILALTLIQHLSASYIITARVEVRNSCFFKRRIEPPHTMCVRLSMICAAIPNIKLRTETKVRCTIKNWCNFNRFNTILNGEFLLNLLRKRKYLTDQFQLCFFALATLNV